MATIGSVTKRDDGRFEGELRTLTIRADIAILPVPDKASPNQPDYRVLSQGIEIGAGWLRKARPSGREYRIALHLGTRVRLAHALMPTSDAPRSGRSSTSTP